MVQRPEAAGRERLTAHSQMTRGPGVAGRGPFEGAEGRGSKPACAGLDGPKNLRLWRRCGAPKALRGWVFSNEWLWWRSFRW